MLKRVYTFHTKLNKRKLFLVSFLVLLFMTFSFSFIGNLIGGDETFSKDTLEDKSLIIIFLTIVVIVPIFETFIFQFTVIELCYLIKSKYNKHIAITTSGLLFGTTHFYNLIYFISAIMMGIGFAYYYTLFRKYGLKFSFLGITAIHIIINFIGFLINYVFNIDI